MVYIGGSPMHTVSKEVTVPEIALLRSIHGPDAVRDITLAGEAVQTDFEGDTQEWNDDEERERLVRVYEGAAPASDRGLVERLFPTLSPLPHRLSQVGIDPLAEAGAKRNAAAKLMEEAAALDDSAKSPIGKAGARGPRVPLEADA